MSPAMAEYTVKVGFWVWAFDGFTYHEFQAAHAALAAASQRISQS